MGLLLTQKPPLPPPRRYALFISHAWKYNEEYEALVNLIKPDSLFLWDNLSIPKKTPVEVDEILSKSYRFLVRRIDEEIKRADCLLVLAGMYASHSGWIQSEIEAAKEYSIPIIAIKPRARERLSMAATHAAAEEAGWNRTSIIAAIHRCARSSSLFPTPPRGLLR